jgi:LCP family protein required for cell wall assembly
LIAVTLLVVTAGAGSYLWFYLQVHGSADPGVGDVVGDTTPGAIGTPSGMDILVLGSDKRTDDAEEERRSDTVLLVHVDPDQKYLSLLSLPRDLRVEIPGHGLDKLNAAYAYGGPSLTVETVELLTGIDIDEYIEVDFTAFADITDALGGVYLDIDRRYYNDDARWELIKISPGYQLLDGEAALDYVRFRRDLNYDFGRMDRQQRFIIAMREQALGWNLALDLPKVVDALFDNVAITLSANDILRLARWVLKLDGSRIRQISLLGDTVTRDGASYVIPPEGAVDEAIADLMTAPSAPDTDETSTSNTMAERTTTTEEQVKFITNPAAIANSRLWHLVASSVPFSVRAPGYLPKGYAYVDRRPKDGGAYDIDGDGNKPAFKMVYQLTREEKPTDQYMGIMETSWLDAPAASPGQVVERGGIAYTIVGTNQRVDRIWWKVDDTLYWVSNTLSYYLSKKELLRVAESMIPIAKTNATSLAGESGRRP